MDQLRADAARILRTCTPATPRATVAWAAGAYQADHALDVVELLAGASFGGEHGSITVHGRPYRDLEHHHKRGMWLDEDGRTLFRFTWAEVAAPLKTLPKEAVDELHAALHERVARTDSFDPTRPAGWWQSPAGIEHNERWREIEDICYGLGARAWRDCRAAAAEPADLLDLLAVSA
jgi:hypothetical protein